MLLMEVCGSEYALPDFFPHALSYSMVVSRQSGEESAQKKCSEVPKVMCSQGCNMCSLGCSGLSMDLLCVSAR